MAEYFLTETGYLKLQEEIQELDRYIRKELAKEIGAAAAHGDLKENGEYLAAREKQLVSLTRLRQLQERFSRATVVRKDELLPRERVTFGKRVKLREAGTGAERVVTILGEGETDPERGVIGYQSPLARALIGHQEGETVEVALPRSTRTYTIVAVDFCEGYQD
jgi:transcription elongation factor GreA